MTPSNEEKTFPIVGIGASARGFDALQRFLAALSREFRFALVLIQHLSPNHKSLLPELLNAQLPSLAIQEISECLKVAPGNLYLAPPGREVRIKEETFDLAVHPAGPLRASHGSRGKHRHSQDHGPRPLRDIFGEGSKLECGPKRPPSSTLAAGRRSVSK